MAKDGWILIGLIIMLSTIMFCIGYAMGFEEGYSNTEYQLTQHPDGTKTWEKKK
jgi:hypothetical protein